MSGWIGPVSSEWVASVNAILADLERRVAEIEAKVEALDASFVRHQGQNEGDVDRLREAVDRVAQDLDRHSDAHWRSGR